MSMQPSGRQVENEDKEMIVTMVCLILLNIKIMKQLCFHPRLNLLPATLVLAADDLIHFIISAGITYVGIGALGWYLFGGVHPMFQTLFITLGTQFELLLGNFPEGWTVCAGPAVRGRGLSPAVFCA